MKLRRAKVGDTMKLRKSPEVLLATFEEVLGPHHPVGDPKLAESIRLERNATS